LKTIKENNRLRQRLIWKAHHNSILRRCFREADFMQGRTIHSNIVKVIFLALALPVLAYSYEFGPPDAHTGGFGEPTCTECHFGTANSFSGKVTISITGGGSPAANYTTGTTYTIMVTDFDTAQRRWGFELSARTQGGAQAGTLIKGTDGFTQIASAAVTTITNPKIQYMEHTLAGTRNGTRDTGSGVSFTFTWTAPDVSAGPVVFNAAGNCANGDNTQNGDHIYTTLLTLQPQAATGPPAPAVSDNGTVNNASFAVGTNPLAPGTIAAIFGTDLNDGSSNPSSSIVNGKLLTTLGGTSVTFNGVAAPIFSSFGSQLNVQIPFELAGMTSAQVVVTTGGQSSAPKTVPIGAQSPGIFTINNQGTGQGAIQIANTVTFAAPAGSISGALAAPANRGVDFLTIYCTGLGAVSNSPATGAPAGSNPLSSTVATPQLSIGGVPASVTFSGLSPGFVGLYQVNAQVPAGTPTGNAVPVALSIGGVQANSVTIAVQ
jgi:uncharacterized protein (TIGR03437 family)